MSLIDSSGEAISRTTFLGRPPSYYRKFDLEVIELGKIEFLNGQEREFKNYVLENHSYAFFSSTDNLAHIMII